MIFSGIGEAERESGWMGGWVDGWMGEEIQNSKFRIQDSKFKIQNSKNSKESMAWVRLSPHQARVNEPSVGRNPQESTLIARRIDLIIPIR
jgi:hypothetical protein